MGTSPSSHSVGKALRYNTVSDNTGTCLYQGELGLCWAISVLHVLAHTENQEEEGVPCLLESCKPDILSILYAVKKIQIQKATELLSRPNFSQLNDMVQLQPTVQRYSAPLFEDGAFAQCFKDVLQTHLVTRDKDAPKRNITVMDERGLSHDLSLLMAYYVKNKIKGSKKFEAQANTILNTCLPPSNKNEKYCQFLLKKYDTVFSSPITLVDKDYARRKQGTVYTEENMFGGDNIQCRAESRDNMYQEVIKSLDNGIPVVVYVAIGFLKDHSGTHHTCNKTRYTGIPAEVFAPDRKTSIDLGVEQNHAVCAYGHSDGDIMVVDSTFSSMASKQSYDKCAFIAGVFSVVLPRSTHPLSLSKARGSSHTGRVKGASRFPTVFS